MKVKVVLPHSIGTEERATARPHQQLQLEGRKVAASVCCACCQMSGLANPKTVSKLPIADSYDMLSEKITLLMIVALDSKRNADGSHAVSSRFASGRSALPDVSLKRVTMCERVKQSSHVSIKPLFVGATALLHTAHFHLTSMKTHSHANQCLVSGGSRDDKSSFATEVYTLIFSPGHHSVICRTRAGNPFCGRSSWTTELNPSTRAGGQDDVS